MQIAPRFKELRKKKNLSQEDLVASYNSKYGKKYTTAAISQFENGKRIPETFALIDFADFFEVSINYLLGVPDPTVKASAPSHSDDLRLTAHEREHITLYRQLDDEYRSIIDRLTRDNAQDAPSSPSTSSETGSRSGSGIKENRRPA